MPTPDAGGEPQQAATSAVAGPSVAPPPAKKPLLEHPLTVLVLGSVLTVVGLPWLSQRMNDSKLINDARLQTCMSILKNSSDSDQRFNAMTTTMQMFIKDSAAAGSASKSDQERLRAELAQQYLEFDRQAWWWISRLPTEAKLLRIDVGSKELGELTSAYMANLVESTRVLDVLWKHCLSRSYKVTDPANKTLSDSTKRQLDQLSSKRGDLIGKFVSMFAPVEPKIQNALRTE